MNDITQADVARAIGVSRSMVSFALNAELSKKLNPASLRRVLETAKRLGYRPHRQARILRGGKSGLVGIIASSGPMQPTAERKFFATQAIRAAGYDLTVAEVRWTENDLEQSVEGMLEARVEGVLVAGLMPDRGLTVLRRLCAAGIPVASVNNLELPFVHWAATDYGQGMTELTRHLLDLGHRRLTYLMAWSRKEADTQATVAARRQGFTRAAAHAGLSPEDAVVMYEVPAKRFMDPHRVGKTGMARILKQRKWPDVVLCANDDTAFGALAACAEFGVRVPDDVAITGYDNTIQGEYMVPPLTSVAQPTEAVARKAVELLLNMIRNGLGATQPKGVVFPCRVIVRQSCGVGLKRSTKGQEKESTTS